MWEWSSVLVGNDKQNNRPGVRTDRARKGMYWLDQEFFQLPTFLISPQEEYIAFFAFGKLEVNTTYPKVMREEVHIDSLILFY